ncbi:MAG: Na+/H+ antiporter NhaA [Myxococcota bacterium]
METTSRRADPILLERLIQPIQVFAAHKLAGAGLLMGSAILALILANSGWADNYTALLETPLSFSISTFVVEKPALLWINDGLMAIFFFLVGMEIKREVIAGELASVRKATLPGVAAIGGMVVPAGVYAAMTWGTPLAAGWGIPMATDIAFALGILALLGDRVPVTLKIFLTALAIVDDIGAVLVIAIFYTDTIAIGSLIAGLVLYAVAIGCNRLQVRSAPLYFILGTLVWLAFLKSGVHATIAALLMAFTIPSRTKVNGTELLGALKKHVDHLRDIGVPKDTRINTIDQQHVIDEMAIEVDNASAPLLRIEHALTPIVSFVVLPIFAFANAGVSLRSEEGSGIDTTLVLAIIAGLFIGKQIGITGFSWVAVKAGIADLPEGVGWRHVYGVSLLAGVGFTMALFIGSLAFPTDPSMLSSAKIGILSGSLLAGVVGYLILRSAKPPKST